MSSHEPASYPVQAVRFYFGRWVFCVRPRNSSLQAMFINYFKTAIRYMLRRKLHSVLNIMGLAVGMTCFILIALWVQDELCYDRFHKNAADIYRVIQNITFTDHTTTWAITQGPLGPSLTEDFAEIINMTRMRSVEFITLTYQDKTFDETITLADGSFFEMFSFPLVKGDSKWALDDPFSIVLSEDMADKYFADGEDPIGRVMTVKMWGTYLHDFVVTGVMRNAPRNSTFRPGFLIPFIFGREINWTVDRWDNSFAFTFVQLQKDVSSQNVVQKISGYLTDKPTIEKDSRLNLQPLTRIHLYSDCDFDVARGDIAYVVVFSIVAVFVLLIGCINYMNLATARFAERAREVGIRKVVGAGSAEIMIQFFGESILTAFLAVLFGMVSSELLLPFFNDLAHKELSLAMPGKFHIVLGLLAVALIAGIISGSYPAVFLSAFQPAKILRGVLLTGTRSPNYRRFLVPFQFSLTILIMICTAVTYNQLGYMQNKKLGYNKDHIFLIGLRGEVRQRLQSVKAELLKHPNILAVTSASAIPTRGFSFTNSLWRWEGQDPDQEILFRGANIGDDYFETYGMEIVRGRGFSKELPVDKEQAVVVNETAVEIMGMTEPIGKHLIHAGKRYQIIGVVRNYHFRSLHHQIEPLILLYREDPGAVLTAKLRSGNLPETIEYIKDTWKEFEPGYPPIYIFADELLNEAYESEKRLSHLFAVFSLLTIFIACLGVFGLASFTVERRTKEIGIRKAFGAAVSNIVLPVTTDFVKWVLLANIIAWPMAYFSMNRWLQNFAYRIDLGAGVFVLSGLLVLAITGLTVGYHAIRAAAANPAEALRYE